MPGYRALQNSSRFRLRLLIVENFDAFQVAVPLHDLVQIQSVIRVLRIRIRNSSSSSSTRIGALLHAHIRICNRFVCGSGRREGRIALSYVLFSLSRTCSFHVFLWGNVFKIRNQFLLSSFVRLVKVFHRSRNSRAREESSLFFFWRSSFSRREARVLKENTRIRERDI